jgi:sodium-dependent dicarboxylate transporter 2/3/5
LNRSIEPRRDGRNAAAALFLHPRLARGFQYPVRMSDEGLDPVPSSRLAHAIQWLGFFAGPLLALVAYALSHSTQATSAPEGAAVLSENGRRVLAIAVWMATWWMTEAVPISVTALLPLVFLPLTRVCTMKEAAAPYADEIIFLFVGGFVIGEALRSSGLHRRIAINTLLAVGTTPTRIVGGVMLATFLISMWVSNTATTIMMLPIGMSLVALVERCAATDEGKRSGWDAGAVRHLAISIVLGIAYAASIGGMGTPVGTPPNVIMLNQARARLGRDVDFGHWMFIAAPLALAYLILSWLVLTRVLHRVRAKRIAGGREMLVSERRSLGPMSNAEWATTIVFLLASCAWVLRPKLVELFHLSKPVDSGTIHLLTDAGIAIAAALLLFLIPTNFKRRQFVVSYDNVQNLPWGILLLFGGGLSIADAMSRTGLDKVLGAQFQGLAGLPQGLIYFVLVAAIVFGGELASNAAVVTALMPILAAAAGPMKMDGLMLMFGATLAASCGFMLPVATPPNALAFATRRVTQPQMIRAGFLLDLIGIALITGLMYFARGRLFPLPGS